MCPRDHKTLGALQPTREDLKNVETGLSVPGERRLRPGSAALPGRPVHGLWERPKRGKTPVIELIISTSSSPSSCSSSSSNPPLMRLVMSMLPLLFMILTWLLGMHLNIITTMDTTTTTGAADTVTVCLAIREKHLPVRMWCECQLVTTPLQVPNALASSHRV